jgi:hypothetical protein
MFVKLRLRINESVLEGRNSRIIVKSIGICEVLVTTRMYVEIGDLV